MSSSLLSSAQRQTLAKLWYASPDKSPQRIASWQTLSQEQPQVQGSGFISSPAQYSFQFNEELPMNESSPLSALTPAEGSLQIEPVAQLPLELPKSTPKTFDIPVVTFALDKDQRKILASVAALSRCVATLSEAALLHPKDATIGAKIGGVIAEMHRVEARHNVSVEPVMEAKIGFGAKDVFTAIELLLKDIYGEGGWEHLGFDQHIGTLQNAMLDSGRPIRHSGSLNSAEYVVERVMKKLHGTYVEEPVRAPVPALQEPVQPLDGPHVEI